MSSRRGFLVGVATTGVCGIAGCSGTPDRTPGSVVRKTASITNDDEASNSVWVSVGAVSLDDDRVTARAQYDPQYVTFGRDAVELSVSTEQHESMNGEFSDTGYVVGVRLDEEERTAFRAVQRSDFNEMRLGGSATISEYTGNDGKEYFRLYETGSRQRDLDLEDEHRFDIRDRI